ncbi:MAG: dihydrofolate reductase family protein [Bacteroidota bacterium]
MRKLRLQMQTTIDGFVARPNGEQDWMTAPNDETVVKYIIGIADDSGTIIMGRNMSGDFLPYWENMADNDKGNPLYDLATRMVGLPKVVFSKTLKNINGRNARVENGDLKTGVLKLKNQAGKDLLVYGGASFVANLVKENLVDEYLLFVNPAAIGEGMRIFTGNHKMKFEESKAFKSGIVLHRYTPLT